MQGLILFSASEVCEQTHISKPSWSRWKASVRASVQENQVKCTKYWPFLRQRQRMSMFSLTWSRNKRLDCALVSTCIKNRREKKPTEICFIESIRLVKKTIYIFSILYCRNQTNIYTLVCISFHVRAQPGWQAFRHFRDEEKSLYSVVHCSQKFPIWFKLIMIFFTPNVRQKSSTNYKLPFPCLSFCCAA